MHRPGVFSAAHYLWLPPAGPDEYKRCKYIIGDNAQGRCVLAIQNIVPCIPHLVVQPGQGLAHDLVEWRMADKVVAAGERGGGGRGTSIGQP